LIGKHGMMEDVLRYLIVFGQIVVEEWVWIALAGSLLLLWWFRRATSPLPATAGRVRRLS
jgi:hypothetical protein